MARATKKTWSAYSQDAMKLFGNTIHAERKARKMSEMELAERVGVSRQTIQRMEKGDPTCAIGTVFEAAHIVGIQLFDMPPSRLAAEQRRIEERLTLLPKAIHTKRKVINDDF